MVNKQLYRILINTWMVLSIGCAQHSDANEIAITEVTGSETDKNKKEFCSDFTIPLKSAEKFFRKAKPISLKQLHDEHDHLPCYSYGTASAGNESCTWEIRAGNTAELRCGNSAKYFTCDNCLEPQ